MCLMCLLALQTMENDDTRTCILFAVHFCFCFLFLVCGLARFLFQFPLNKISLVKQFCKSKRKRVTTATCFDVDG